MYRTQRGCFFFPVKLTSETVISVCRQGADGPGKGERAVEAGMVHLPTGAVHASLLCDAQPRAGFLPQTPALYAMGAILVREI